MRAFVTALGLALTSAACASTRAAHPPVARSLAPAASCPAVLDGADAFASRGVEGTFLLRDDATGCTRATDPAIADTPFLPASTFKIPNTLIGLEAGVISGEHHLFRWDGVTRAYAAWNHDMELGEALKVSCVPCFQQVARGVGLSRMRDFAHRFAYGNETIEEPIDRFWLDGSLRITPRQQTEFLHRMIAGALPVKREHVALVMRLLEIERRGDATIVGKTGLTTQDGRAIGWLVGVVTRGDRRSTYATFVRAKDGDGARLQPLRKEIAMELLARAGAIPAR